MCEQARPTVPLSYTEMPTQTPPEIMLRVEEKKKTALATHTV